MPAPRVSVLFPVHNGARYLRAAIQSLLEQTFTDFEIEIMNDGSTDDSADIVRSYRDPRIRYSEQARAGVSMSLNRLLERARGFYLARMDHDDWSSPDRLQAQVEYLDSHPDRVLVGSWIEVMDEEGRVVRRARFPVTSSGLREEMLFTNPVAHGSVMLRRVPELEYRPEYDHAEDLDLWVRLAARYRAANLPRYLYRWRMNPEGISRAKREEQSAVAERVLDRYRKWYLSRISALAPTREELLEESKATGMRVVANRKLKMMRLLLAHREAGAWGREARDLLTLPFLR